MKYWLLFGLLLLAAGCDSLTISGADRDIAIQVCANANQEAHNDPAKMCYVQKSGDYENGYKYNVTFVKN